MSTEKQTDLVDAVESSPAKAKAKPVKAKVSKAFSGCPDGQIDTQDFVEGDEIEGDLARAMVEAGFAKPAKG